MIAIQLDCWQPPIDVINFRGLDARISVSASLTGRHISTPIRTCVFEKPLQLVEPITHLLLRASTCVVELLENRYPRWDIIP
jgi:hypothetical protein